MKELSESTHKNPVVNGWPQEKDETWARPSFALRPSLLRRLDFWIETSYVPYDSRSELVRELVLEKLAEWESQHLADQEYTKEAR